MFICIKCNSDKEDFERVQKGRNTCKICAGERQKEYDLNHKEQKKKYTLNNKERFDLLRIEYIKKPEVKKHKAEYDKIYVKKNKERVSEVKSNWYFRIGKPKIQEKNKVLFKGNYETKPEKQIRLFLEKYKIEFKQEYSFNKIHSFDFYLEKFNLCIEYDGEVHYKPMFGIERFLIGKKRDYIKNKFCKQNNINLLRIPYWDLKQINNILKYKLCVKN